MGFMTLEERVKHFRVGDWVEIGEPPYTETYVVEGLDGAYAKVRKAGMLHPQIHTVYMGRWFNVAEGYMRGSIHG